MTYTAYGSFAPLYIEPKQKLVSNNNGRDRVTFFTLEALAWHCDSIGMCWPGTKRLASLVGYAVASIEDALAKLFQMDYLRAHVTVSPGGRRRITWQLSPYVIWIVPEHIETALTEWDAATLRSWNAVMEIESKESQPDSLTSSKNQPKTSQKPAPPVTNSEKPKRPATSANGAAVANGDGRTPQNHHSEHSDTNTATNSAERATPQREAHATAPPNSAPPPPLSPDAERVAESVRDLPPGTRLGQAKELVQQFGAERVRVGVLWARQEHRAGRARNPQGLLRSWLHANCITDDDAPQQSEPFTHSEYSEFIHS